MPRDASEPHPVIGVSGAFLLAPITGVQRFAYQLLLGLLEERPDLTVRVYVPPLPPEKQPLVHRLRTAGAAVVVAPRWAANKQVFEQLAFPRLAARDGAALLVHLNNNVSFLARRPQVCFVYDAAPVRLPETYRWAYRAKFRLVLTAARRRKVTVATLSEFSRAELASVGVGVTAVIPAGAGSPMLIEAAIAPKESVASTALESLPDRPFALMLGSADPRKRVQEVVDAWPAVYRALGLPLVVVQGTAPTHRAATGHDNEETGVIRLHGRISDADLAVIARDSAMAIFASCYEGGALAAQEILALGTPVLASDIPTFRELLAAPVQFFSGLDQLAPACAQLLGQPRPAAMSADDAHAAWKSSARLFAEQLLRG